MNVRCVEVRNLTDEDFRLCLQHNLGFSGRMQSQLQSCRNGRPPWSDDEGRAYIAEDDSGEFLGWALTFYSWRDHKPMTYFYTLPEYRRCGVGRLLAEYVKDDEPTTKVQSWDETSRAFFSVTFVEADVW